jgi:hypothetical protein
VTVASILILGFAPSQVLLQARRSALRPVVPATQFAPAAGANGEPAAALIAR